MRGRKAFIAVTAIMITFGMSFSASGAGWQKDETGWIWQKEDGSRISGQWEWLDGNEDGIAECYYFDQTGYMQSGGTTPDGYMVNAEGAWIVEGVVQTKTTKGPETNAVSVEEDDYNEWGLSKTALAMLNNSREENEKYGEVRVSASAISTGVFYTNGFFVVYPSNGSAYKHVMALDMDSNWHNEKLFKYYDSNLTSGEEAEKYLLNKGWIRGAYGPKACYADGSTVWVNVGDEVLNWEFHRTPSFIILR